MKVPALALPLVAALVSGFFLGGATAKDSSLFGPTVAAWVQAIGSIVAIWAGFRLADYARKHAEEEHRRQARRDEINAYNHALDASRLAFHAIVSCREALAGAGESVTSQSIMVLARRAEGGMHQIDSVEMSRVQDINVNADLVGMRTLVQSAADQLNSIFSPIDGLPNTPKNVAGRLAAALNNLEQMVVLGREVGERMNVSVAAATGVPIPQSSTSSNGAS